MNGSNIKNQMGSILPWMCLSPVNLMIEYAFPRRMLHMKFLTNINSPEHNLKEVVSTLSLGWPIVWFPADDNKPSMVKLFDNFRINNYEPLEVMELNSNLTDLSNKTARRFQNWNLYEMASKTTGSSRLHFFNSLALQKYELTSCIAIWFLYYQLIQSRRASFSAPSTSIWKRRYLLLVQLVQDSSSITYISLEHFIVVFKLN